MSYLLAIAFSIAAIGGFVLEVILGLLGLDCCSVDCDSCFVYRFFEDVRQT